MLIQIKAILHRALMFVNPGLLSILYNSGTVFTAGETGVSRQDALSYHSQRATHELDLGLSAGSASAARAHLELASMHLQRLRELTEKPAPIPLSAVG